MSPRTAMLASSIITDRFGSYSLDHSIGCQWEHPFILLTAKADEELRLRLLREGAIDYLVKPFIQEELRSKARNFLAVKASEAKYRGLMESAQVDVGTGRGVAG
jgi:DNA-binding response OmpR family regulator